MPTAHWVHLDLKGNMPSAARMLEWLEWLRGRGFDGVVFEYEDRIPWETWPGTYRAGLTLAEWQRVWRRAEELGLEVVPLVQTFGHLEWLLKHERCAALREAGFWNLLCPNHADVMPQLERWLDEVIRLHPGGRYVHVGLDEVFNLATCPLCQKQARATGGKMGVYLAHARRVCEHVLRRGRKPIIWADMFLNHNATDLAKELPGAVLCDWQYEGAGPFASTAKLAASGCEITGASAIRPGWDPQHEFVSPLGPRLVNVTSWHKPVPGVEASAVMHTTWARSRSLLPLFGPWEGWVPAFIKAGDANAKLSDAMARGVELVDAAMASRTFQPMLSAIAELDAMKPADPFEREAIRWWKLALRYQHELWWVTNALVITTHQWRAVREHVGFDPALADLKAQERAQVLTNLDELEKDVRAYFADNRVSDAEEFVAANIDSVRKALAQAAV